MKIEEMSDIQDVMKCHKDKKYAAQIRARQKEIRAEAATVKSKMWELDTKARELREESAKVGRILAQAKGLKIYNEIAIAVVTRGKKILINRAGDSLEKYGAQAFMIQKNYKKEITDVRFANHYLSNYKYGAGGKSNTLKFPELDILKDIGCKYIAGLLTADQAKDLIEKDMI